MILLSTGTRSHFSSSAQRSPVSQSSSGFDGRTSTSGSHACRPRNNGQVSSSLMWSWAKSSMEEESSDFHKMSDFLTGLRTKITTTERSMKKVHFPKHEKVMDAQLPKELFEIEERAKTLKRISLDQFEKFDEWMLKGECNTSETGDWGNVYNENLDELRTSKLDHTEFDRPRKLWIEKTEKIRKDTSELDKKKMKFDGHVARSRMFLQRVFNIWEIAQGHFHAGMVKATELQNIYIYIYLIVGYVTLYFGFWSPVCTMFFTKYQLDGYWVKLMRRLFYLNAIFAIVLSSFEIYSTLTFRCSPILMNYEFDDFEIPSYQTGSMFKVKDVFKNCSSNQQTIFSAINNINEVSHSNFTDGLEARLAYESMDVFNMTKSIDIEVLKPKPKFDLIGVILERIVETCPSLIGPIQPARAVIKSMRHYSHIHNASGSLEKMASDAFGEPMKRMYQFINKPVDQFNKIIRGTDINCSQYQDVYMTGYMLSCNAVNQVFIDLVKMAVIGCSALLVVLRLFYLRRADDTQFWDDPRVRWAHKFMTDNVDDEQYRVWMTINSEDPPNVTYDHFTKRKNKKRNRFADVGLIDQSRVVLTNHVTDYIHASWIPIPGTNRRYIATQAPKPKTYKEFWHMLLQEKVKIHIMLTGFIELDNRICDHYFPFYVGDKEIYGHVEVTCEKIERAPKETGLWLTERRTMKIVDLDHPDALPHYVNHIWFMSWYMEMVPIGLERVNDLQRYIETLVEDDSLICVLDHTGVDRTGVYIALDYANALIVQDKFISMVDVVEDIAARRWGVLTTFVPYFFLFTSLTHRFIFENFLFHEDWVVPLKKYRDTLMNRVGKQDTWRGNKQISIQYWKYRYDPPWW